MNILNYNLSPEMFSFKEGVIGGDDCVLITPQNITCKWEEESLKFRSIIIRKSDGLVVSRSFPKFFNWNEQPDLNKFPDGPFEVVEKQDGSLIIWGVHNDELIHRTRNTFDCRSMANGHEIDFLISKYPKLISAIRNNPDYSILTEWETITNIIVIRRITEPTLTLVGVVNNKSGQLVSQSELDKLATAWGIDRPKRYKYNTIQECIDSVVDWNDREGVVAYSSDGQYLRKIKSEWYLSMHRVRTGMVGLNQVLEVFLKSPRYTVPEDFYNYMVSVIDFEVAEKCKDFIDDIVNAWVQYLDEVANVNHKLDNYIRPLETRKEQALAIKQLFGSGWWTILAFIRLDNREVDETFEMKVMKGILKL